MSRYRNLIVDAIKQIDTNESDKWNYGEELQTKVVEEQKVYFWIRLYLKEENNDVKIGDDIVINYLPSGEKLVTKFACYAKQGLEKDHVDEVVNFNPEDNKKVLCLLIDIKSVNFNDEIPFIRTLFKSGYHYEYQLIRREELQFMVQSSGLILDYFDVDF